MTTVQESPHPRLFEAVTRYREPASLLHHWWEPGVIHVAGDVDESTAPAFREALIACDDDPCIQALDLSAVEFFSTAGVGCFVERAWTVRPHAAVIASRHVRRVLTLCDLEFLLGRHGWRTAYDGWHVTRYPAF